MSQPSRRPGIPVGDERHILEALWSSKNILTLRGGPWVWAVSGLGSCLCSLFSLGFSCFLLIFPDFTGFIFTESAHGADSV